MKSWLTNYFNLYKNTLFDESIYYDLITAKEMIQSCSDRKKKIIIVGNGGSAAIASHFSVDITKNAGVKCINFNEAGLITCFSNDYGYERWVEKAIEFYGESGDLAIFISSSGNSPNIIKGVETAKSMGVETVTFSGFSRNNKLSNLGKINFWVNSKAYNIVENVHQIWLLSIVDMIIGNPEYPA